MFFRLIRLSVLLSLSVLEREENLMENVLLFVSYCVSFIFTFMNTIEEISVRVKISYSSARGLSYAINFCTARVVSHTLHGICIWLSYATNFILSAKSTKIRNQIAYENICDYSMYISDPTLFVKQFSRNLI